jgi:hypothetical protein
VKFYTGNKKIWKFILEVYIRKKIDKNLEKFPKPFQTTNLIGNKKKKNPGHNVLW